jgi:hypothetical protein
MLALKWSLVEAWMAEGGDYSQIWEAENVLES